MTSPNTTQAAVAIEAAGARLQGDLTVPPGARGLVLFAHGSGSSRKSPRNRFVAQFLVSRRLATLLFDLLTREEEAIDARTAHLRFDIGLLASRLSSASAWVAQDERLQRLPLGYFGASTGAAAALMAAAGLPQVQAVVSRGGRPDLAGAALASVRAPTLLIVGGADRPVIELNRSALAQLRCEKDLVIVPDATHLFEEPGALEQVAELAASWFIRHLHAGEGAASAAPERRTAP
jgi:putative phosphoribosyl transferase